MKDIENMLSKHTPKPKRPLHDDFSKTVVLEIESRPQLSTWRKFLLTLRIRLLSRVWITSVAGVILVSGTVAALALWPKPSVTSTITMELPSGNHIVGYDTQNCNYFDELNGGPIKPTHEKIYYEIRPNAPLTDQQFKDTLQAVCEDNVSNAAVNHLVQQMPNRNTPGFESTASYVINAISSKSITVSLDPHLNAAMYTTKPSLTYTRFSDNLLTYDQDTKVPYNDFKVGDTIKMIVQDITGKSSETIPGYVPLNDPENIIILAILKTPPLTADPSGFYTEIGKYVVRVESCKSSPTGFCRAYNFIN